MDKAKECELKTSSPTCHENTIDENILIDLEENGIAIGIAKPQLFICLT